MSSLVLCLSCERHVRVDERTCVFCGEPLPKLKRQAGALGPVLSRAALLVAGAAAGASVASCADDPEAEDGEQGDPEQRGGPLQDQEEQMAQPAYGVPIDDAGLAQPAYGIPVDPIGCDPPPMAQPAYGVPIVPDAPGTKRDAGPPLAQPAYGIPIDRDASVPPPSRRDAGIPPSSRRDGSLPLPQPAYGVPIDNS